MHRSKAALIALALTLLPTMAGANGQSGEEDAIREIVRRVEAGWNAHSGAGFAAPFAEDADYVVVNGMYIKGRQAIAEGHQQIFDTVYKESRNSSTVLGVRFLRPDVALAHVRWHNRFTRDGAPAETQAMNTMVLTKGADGWSIAAFHNTYITPPGAPPAAPPKP